MVSLPLRNQTWYHAFLLLSYLVFVQEICQIGSQNLDNISFTSNYIKYLEFTTASLNCAYNSVKNGRHLKKKKQPEVTYTWY